AAVCVVGVITSLEEAEGIIADGKADIVAMAKSLMSDQHLVQKSLKGKMEDVRPCTRCDLCGNHQMFGTPMACMINPRFKILGDIEPVAEKDRKKVLVVGGGPAGMMAAQTATARGHAVTLCEKSDRLGGLLNDATQLPFKKYMRLYLAWDKRATEACGALINLKAEVTAETVEKETPDAIIVATGSGYLTPPIPGIDLPHVVPVREADAAPQKLGMKVVVCGGGLSGLECALSLAQEGKKVTVIDMIPSEMFSIEMPVFNRSDLLIRLEGLGVILRGNLMITAFTEEGVEARDADGKAVKLEADNCVNALGVKPDNALGLELLAKYPADVYLVGDCVGPGRNYGNANHDAYNAAMRI
ncbi:MAG: FAD-dependent oxidoreductase, partial [Clostridiales Family XIII bacterium]|nr:FAD-dependent oxidoreductase [Clostridiales Family XIII bacterium]